MVTSQRFYVVFISWEGDINLLMFSKKLKTKLSKSLKQKDKYWWNVKTYFFILVSAGNSD